jgi:hypothetical protein
MASRVPAAALPRPLAKPGADVPQRRDAADDRPPAVAGRGRRNLLASDLLIAHATTKVESPACSEHVMNLTTILIILVVLAVLGGGWGYSRRGRL